MKAAGIIFSNIHDRTVPEMTARRTMASLPIGGRYRLVDFALSNMVNSDITKVGIVTHNNYRSLVDHIGTGKDWDLARRSGGVTILPPFITAFDNPKANSLYTTRLEALMGVMEFISHCKEEIIVLSDSDMVCNIDLADVIESHEESESDITIVTKKLDLRNGDYPGGMNIIYSDDDGRIKDIVEYSGIYEGECDVSTNIMVVNRDFLLNMLHTSISHGFTDYYHQALPFCMYSAKYRVYKYEGFCATVHSIASYFSINMQFLSDEVRRELFETKIRPIFTKVRNSAPTVYAAGAKVSDCLIADGCKIEGEVENSILFRGVHVKKGTKISNSILLQNTNVGENVTLNCVITDKDVVIRDDRMLSGHETMPFYITKGKMI